LTANDIIQHAPPKRRKKTGDECAKELADMLQTGPKPSEELDKALRELGYSAYAIKGARRKLGVTARR
jgi:hypothetical protein